MSRRRREEMSERGEVEERRERRERSRSPLRRDGEGEEDRRVPAVDPSVKQRHGSDVNDGTNIHVSNLSTRVRSPGPPPPPFPLLLLLFH